MTRAEELAAKVLAVLPDFAATQLSAEEFDKMAARAALSDLVADAEALAEALDYVVRWVRYGEGDESTAAEKADAALARYRGESHA